MTKVFDVNCYRKRFIQEILYRKSSFDTDVDALILASKAPDVCVNNTFKYICGKTGHITTYENNFKNWLEQSRILQTHPLIERINYVFDKCGVINADACQYIDLDLMCFLNSESKKAYELISNMFSKQLEKFPNTRKVLSFTVSARGKSIHKDYGVEDIYTFLSNMLKTDIKPFCKLKFVEYKNLYEYQIILSNPNFIVNIYYYNDTSPMFTVLIQSL